METLSYSTIERVNGAIAYLYSSYDLPLYNRVINFFYKLQEIVYFDRATLIFFEKGDNGLYRKNSSISLNWSEDNIRKYTDYYCSIDDVLPAIDRAYHIMFKSSAFFNQAEREKTEYYRDHLLPNNYYYAIEGNVILTKEKNLKAGLSFSRGKEKNDFSDEELNICKLLQVHFSNILSYTERDSLASILDDYNSLGVGILDNYYEIVKANATFVKQYNSKTEGRNQLLRKKIVQLCDDLKKHGNMAGSLTTEYKLEDEPFFLEVSIASMSEDARRMTFCCLIYDLTYFYEHTLVQLQAKYNLTEREMDVVKSVLKGYNNEVISKRYYISLPTVKRCLTSVYEKMDIKSSKQIFEKLKILT